MEAMIKTHVEVSLKMNKKSALWLRALMQNPIENGPEMDEPETDENADMRAGFFEALNDLDDLELGED